MAHAWIGSDVANGRVAAGSVEETTHGLRQKANSGGERVVAPHPGL
jgi:hypothetical protein